MKLAHLAWKNADLGQMLRLLAASCPSEEQADLRGFEWHYVRRLAHADRRILRGHDGEVYRVAFSPDGRTVATCGMDQTVRLWDGRPHATLAGHKGSVSSVAFAPDGKTLASAGSDQTVRLWDVATGQEVLTLPHAGLATCLAFSPDGATLASGGRPGGEQGEALYLRPTGSIGDSRR